MSDIISNLHIVQYGIIKISVLQSQSGFFFMWNWCQKRNLDEPLCRIDPNAWMLGVYYIAWVSYVQWTEYYWYFLKY